VRLPQKAATVNQILEASIALIFDTVLFFHIWGMKTGAGINVFYLDRYFVCHV